MLALPVVLAAILASPPSRPPVAVERSDDPYLPGDGVAASAGGNEVVFGDYVHEQVNVDDSGGDILFDAANEPSIAVDPTAPNRLAIGWRQFDNVSSSFRQAGYNYSIDGGRTWAGYQVIDPGLFRSDPVLLAGPDGTFYYNSLHVSQSNDFIASVFISDDGGATWDEGHFAFGGDKQWMAIDDTGGPGQGHLYQPWNIAGNSYFPAQFNRSVDGGFNWSDPVEYDPVNGVAMPVFGTVTVGPDGAVYVAGTVNNGANDVFWVVRSTNAQNAAQTVSFDQITEIDLGGTLELGAGPNPSGLLGQVQVEVDRSGGPGHGDIYVLASVNPSGSDPMDVHIIRSQDNGATFEAPVRVNDDAMGANRWSWFGTMDVAPNGRIDVVFNDTRSSLQDNLSELYYTFSTDGGQTWAPNVPISPVFDSFLGFPNQNKIGDYYQLVSDDVGAHLAWAATFTGGQNVYYVRIGDYDCNGNGIGDADDLAAMTSADCNGNGIPDECDIASGVSLDGDANGIPDECQIACPWDCADGNGQVDTVDFLALLGQWSQVGTPCDFNGDGVNTVDFLDLLANWGACD